MTKETRSTEKKSPKQGGAQRKSGPAKRAAPGSRKAKAGNEGERIFAMDIGTRSVIGLVGAMRDDRMTIDAVAIEEYQNRAVVDGQIEDIRETAKIAKKVKQRLEEKTGRKLSKVYIAAAGRVLKTGEAEYEADIPYDQDMDAVFVAKIEFAAIQKVYEGLMAQEREEGEQTNSFLCVGHSVVNYKLDGYEFSTLIGHKGTKAAARVIATFLPKEVVDSLGSTMSRIGLTVAGITLEPIAAINAVIPADLRRLNLALVDIGAGTADIAVCENGSVSAYTMATVAGDEVTEAIMEACLADFATAEELKKQLGSQKRIIFTNILGFDSEINGDMLYQQIMPAVDQLVKVIGEKIKGVNKKPPAAVFLVGGGSQLPNLCAMVAGELGLDENRVAVGGSANMKKQVSSAEEIFGPEFATPLGIAITATQREKDEAFVAFVNGDRIPMAGVWEMTVLDVLQLAGYRYSQIMGRAGKSLIYTYCGERRSLRGGLPGASEISRNGEACALGDKVAPGDQIVFQPATAGDDAVLAVREAVGAPKQITVRVNGVKYSAGRFAMVNNRLPEPDRLIRSMDAITEKVILTVDDLCRDLEVNLDLYEIYVNDKQEFGAYALSEGDSIETRNRAGGGMPRAESAAALTGADAPQSGTDAQTGDDGLHAVNAIKKTVTDEQARITEWQMLETEGQAEPAAKREGDAAKQASSAVGQAGSIMDFADMAVNQAGIPANQMGTASGQAGSAVRQVSTAFEQARGTGAQRNHPGAPLPIKPPLLVCLNDHMLRLPAKEDGEPYLFVDMFSFADIDPQNPQGALVQTVNGKEASYMLELAEGDEISIHWQHENHATETINRRKR